MAKLTSIEGVAESYAKKLKKSGVGSVEGLLQHGASKKGREELSAAAGISEKMILKWVNHADLFRVKGIAGEYAELLEASGVDTIPELAQRNAANLAAKMEEVNKKKKLVRLVPSAKRVTNWVDQAKKLDKIVRH